MRRVDEEQVRAFERLCQQLGVAATVRTRIVERVVEAYSAPVESARGWCQAPKANTFNSGRETSPTGRQHAAGTEKRAADAAHASETCAALKGRRMRGFWKRWRLTRLTILPTNTWLNGNACQCPGAGRLRAGTVAATGRGTGPGNATVRHWSIV